MRSSPIVSIALLAWALACAGTARAAGGVRADCPGTASRLVEVTWTPPAGVPVAGAAVSVVYPNAKVALPGDGGDETVKAHVLDPSAGAMASANDLGDRVTIALVRVDGIAKGHLVTLDFRDCAGAAAPTADDFRCSVTDTSDPSGNLVPGATCDVVLR